MRNLLCNTKRNVYPYARREKKFYCDIFDADFVVILLSFNYTSLIVFAVLGGFT